jgi:hypothetical protein
MELRIHSPSRLDGVVLNMHRDHCALFNDKSISLQRYGVAQNYRITYTVAQRLFQHTPKFRTTVIFKSFVKQNKDSNKTRRHVHDLLLYHI